MVEEILPNIFRIQIPLPKNPLQSLNSYLIKDEERFLLIDTGFNREECRQAMSSGLQELGVDLHKTDIFVTHLHADHLGQAGALLTDTSKIYFNHTEAPMMNADASGVEKFWQGNSNVYLLHGFPEDDLKKALESHPGRRFYARRQFDFHVLKEGDKLEIGDYRFRCVETPGHSPGHMCLYEADKKILVAGDHILFDITPNISFWLNMDNPLKSYLASLDKVYALDVNIVLPGHRTIMKDHRQRIRELREHHKDRLNEALAALAEGEKNVFQTVPYIKWDVEFRSWETFPPAQQWFAFGETLAHLLYLEGEGKIRRKVKDGRITFALA